MGCYRLGSKTTGFSGRTFLSRTTNEEANRDVTLSCIIYAYTCNTTARARGGRAKSTRMRVSVGGEPEGVCVCSAEAFFSLLQKQLRCRRWGYAASRKRKWTRAACARLTPTWHIWRRPWTTKKATTGLFPRPLFFPRTTANPYPVPSRSSPQTLHDHGLAPTSRSYDYCTGSRAGRKKLLAFDWTFSLTYLPRSPSTSSDSFTRNTSAGAF